MPVQIDPKDPTKGIITEGFEQDSPETGGIVDIDSGVLKSSPKIEFKDVAETTPTDTQAIVDAATAPTKKEEKETSLIDDIMKLSGQQEEAAQYRSGLETGGALPGLEASEQDIIASINALHTESQRLQNEKTLVSERLQKEFAGRGVTAGGIAPFERGKIRDIALQQADVASRALTQQAQLEGIRGNIAAANILINRAVQEKYGPLEEILAAKTANLKIVQQLPDLTQEEKKKALALQKQLEQEKFDLNAERTRQENINKMILNATPDLNNHPQGNEIRATVNQIDPAREDAELLVAQTLASFGIGVPQEVVPGAPTGTISDTPDEPLSINQIDTFRRSYGWTPPFGYTESQLLQYIADNPGKTPAELQARAEQIAGEQGDPLVLAPESDKLVKTIMDKLTETDRKTLEKKAKNAGFVTKRPVLGGLGWKNVYNIEEYLQSKVGEALSEGYSEEEILSQLLK